MSKREAPEELWSHLVDEDPMTSAQALEDLATHYQYLVEAISRKLEKRLPSYLDSDELLSFGQMGLLKALGRYDLGRGPFSRYASAVIYGAIIDGLRAADFAPRGLRTKQREMDKATQALQNEGVPQPTDSEVAERMGVSVEEIRETNLRILRAEVVPTDPSVMLKPSEVAVDSWTRMMSREFVSWLCKRDEMTQKVIALLYWKGLNPKQVGSALKIPQEQVREKHFEVLDLILPFMSQLASSEEG